MWDFRFFFFLSAELANSLEPSNGRGPFVRELIKHSSQKNTKYRDSIDDDSILTCVVWCTRPVISAAVLSTKSRGEKRERKYEVMVNKLLK